MREKVDWGRAPEGTSFVARLLGTFLKVWFKEVRKDSLEVWDLFDSRWVPVPDDVRYTDVEYPPTKLSEQELFMRQFRDDEFLNSLSSDDRQELFLHALVGSSDITVKLLKELLSDYCVDNIVVCDRQDLLNFVQG